MIKFYPFVLSLLLMVACSERPYEKPRGNEIVRVKYNNPDLIVDLGVGLWAWPLPMDYDKDGDLDLIVSSAGMPFNGTYFFENQSDGEQTMPVFAPPEKIGPGKRHVQVSYVNGEPRILIRGLEYKNFRETQYQDTVNIFPKEVLEDQHESVRFSQWKYVDFDNDGDQDMIAGISDWSDYGWDNAYDEQGNWTNGPLHGYVYLLENENGSYVSRGKLQAGGSPIDTYGAPTPNMEDFDGDGDLDLICGEFLDRFTWFENIGTREQPKFAEGRFLENDSGIIKMDLEMIIPVAIDWNKDGHMDLVVGDEDGRVALVKNSGENNENMPVFESPAYFQQEADNLKFGALSTPYSVDWDNDGDEDIITGNTAGYIGFIENLDGGNPPMWENPKRLKADGEVIRIMAEKNGSIQGPAEAKWGYTTLSVVDWDHDGLKDIIANSIWGEVLWYKNIGTETAPKLAAARPVQIRWEGEPKKPEWNWWDPKNNNFVTQWRTTPNAIDWNEDGLMDLVMLDHEGYLAFFERVEEPPGVYSLRPGQRIFYGVNHSGFRGNGWVIDNNFGLLRLNVYDFGRSGRRKIAITDWDKDGDRDLLVNSRNISLLENIRSEEDKLYFVNRGTVEFRRLAGHSTSPTTVDWDDDGFPDLFFGAEDGQFYYFENPHR